MKPFTIRKATGPKVAVSQAEANSDPNAKYTVTPDGGGDQFGLGVTGSQELDGQVANGAQLHQEDTVFSPEEIQALQPKKTAIVNPWIHE